MPGYTTGKNILYPAIVTLKPCSALFSEIKEDRSFANEMQIKRWKEGERKGVDGT